MKKLLIILSIGLMGCENNKPEPQVVDRDFKFQLYNIKGGFQYYVIEFKSHEYLATSHGGIVHVESCICN